jgi:membrane peptidoglycan carboxypeptidase
MQIAKHLREGTGRPSTEKEKVGDIVMALRIEREFTRQELLVKYVNMPYFGRGQYGIEAASRAYFGRPAKDLSLSQVAFIVALINKPALPDRTFATDPALKAPEQIRDANWGEQARGTVRVLDLMRDQDEITEVEYERAANYVQTSLRSEVLPKTAGCGTNDHFLERVRILYKDRFPITKGGLTISITRDDALQDVLAKAVRHDACHVSRAASDDTTTTSCAPARSRSSSPATCWPRSERRLQAAQVRRHRDGLAAAGIDVQDLHVRRHGRAAREGGTACRSEGVARNDRRQGPRALHVLDAPIFVSLGRGRGSKQISNFYSRSEPQYRGEISCKIALGESRNTAAMRAGARAGIKNVIDLAYRVGLPKETKHMLQPYPTTAIGASEVNPLSMASTAAFLNGGFRVTPRFANDVCSGASRSSTRTTTAARRPAISRGQCASRGARHAPCGVGSDDRAPEGAARHRADGHGSGAAVGRHPRHAIR